MFDQNIKLASFISTPLIFCVKLRQPAAVSVSFHLQATITVPACLLMLTLKIKERHYIGACLVLTGLNVPIPERQGDPFKNTL